MTAKQKANRERFKKVVAEAKKLRKKNPGLTQAQAVKQAWAIMYSTGKVAGYSKERKELNKEVTKEIRKKRKRNPDAFLNKYRKKEAIKEAYATTGLSGIKKKAKPTKVKAKKGKSSGEMHTDTKSHNVNIRVMSGIDDQMSAIRNNLENSIDYYMKRIAMIQNAFGHLSASEKLQAKKIIKRYKTTITKLLKQLRETNQIIAKNVK